MFFKREKAKETTFSTQLDKLRSAGYTVEASGSQTRVVKGKLGALVQARADVDQDDQNLALCEVGLVVGPELALLTDLGFQKIFMTPSGKKMPALAEHLVALHAFEEDFREAAGLTSLYNHGLGTTNEKHLYDRVQDRDHGVPKRPWETN
ncbi:hypothetical protein [Paludibaculum fermentans]|uniref:Uncharacterized protein n=1 Tax=Paludibaculum fermentans TaxID=1473598 RepID=A0A7S7SLJ7_PALFE|nr:hypothetical protein [Paludibaculum fermentans]QOY89439.1 hypothetical protein IRI77_05655 [Paludibaculum fermentans]